MRMKHPVEGCPVVRRETAQRIERKEYAGNPGEACQNARGGLSTFHDVLSSERHYESTALFSRGDWSRQRNHRRTMSRLVLSTRSGEHLVPVNVRRDFHKDRQSDDRADRNRQSCGALQEETVGEENKEEPRYPKRARSWRES